MHLESEARRRERERKLWESGLLFGLVVGLFLGFACGLAIPLGA
jgi:hypothetical protein